MRLMWAVPMLALVEADSEDAAYEQAAKLVQEPLTATVGVLLDEGLNAFAYDSETTEVHSVLESMVVQGPVEQVKKLV